MKNEKVKNKYWENEEGELIVFGSSFMRYYPDAGKLQFGQIYFDYKTGEKKYAAKFALDRDELLKNDAAVQFLYGVLNDWTEE